MCLCGHWLAYIVGYIREAYLRERMRIKNGTLLSVRSAVEHHITRCIGSAIAESRLSGTTVVSQDKTVDLRSYRMQ